MIRLLLDDRLAWLFLSRPKANILDAAMIGALSEALASVPSDAAALVIAADGPHFSFGASVEEHERSRAASMLAQLHDLFRRLDALSVPLIASVHGQCLGGGFELAAFCHFLFAHPDSRLGQPEIKLGVFPPMASVVLPLRLPALADRLILTGEAMTAREIAPFGLVTGLDEDPDAAAARFARTVLTPLSASSLRQAARASRWPIRQALATVLPQIERQYLEELMASRDANEGIASFEEKRPPRWEHR